MIEIKSESESTKLSPSLLKQLKLLIETPEGTVVLDRDFGLKRDFIDLPINMVIPRFAAELAIKLEKYIPAIILKEVMLGDEKNFISGELNLKVVVNLAE